MAKRFTDRLTVLRQRELNDFEKDLLDIVEKHGWMVLSVDEGQGVPGFSYTIGVYDTTGKPELIVAGLDSDLRHSVLNNAAERLREGASLEDKHRESDLLAKVDCEFRPVQPRWAEHVMNSASWFYGDTPFPSVQVIYPDLQNRFPWEEGFEESWRERQPLLFKGAVETHVEKHFWEANEDGSVYDGWVFSESPHTGAYTTQRINNQDEPITYVVHDENGDWQFHGPSESYVDSGVVVCLHHIVDRDPTIKELADLPVGWSASRDKLTDPWKREQEPLETEDQ